MFDYTKCGGKNRGIRKVDRGFLRYTVYDNRTDELVILDGTAELFGVVLTMFDGRKLLQCCHPCAERESQTLAH